MRIARSASAWLIVVLLVARAEAQVSCANPDDLCTGDPCVMTNIEVQSPCTVDFGARALKIAGILRVPDGGTLSFTAASIVQQGPIDGRHVGNGTGNGAAITLLTTTGDIESRGKIDVAGTNATGSIMLQAAGNVLVKDNLIAKPAGSNIVAVGGSVTVNAGGTVTTDQTAVLDVDGAGGAAGIVSVNGDAGVTIRGRVIAEGDPAGTIAIGSSAGMVRIERDLRVLNDNGSAGNVIVAGAGGVVVDDKIRASSELATGGTVQIASANGDVVINETVNVSGVNGGIMTLDAPLGAVVPNVRLNGRATDGIGGTIAISAATITLRKDLEVRSRSGDGGQISLLATTLLDMAGGDAEAAGKVSGGEVDLLGGAGSGDIRVQRSSSITASGSAAGGFLFISAPAGAVTFDTKVTLTGGIPGQAQVDGAALTFTRASIRADGKVGGGQLRFNQSGSGTFLLDGTFQATSGGAIEALAPAGNLTARGRFRVRATGCVGFSAGGTLNTTGAVTDVAITPTCP